MHTNAFDAVARTSLLTAAIRGRESTQPHRLYEDPYASTLCGAEGLALLEQIEAITGANRGAAYTDGRKLPSTLDYNAIRTRFLDDWLLGTLARTGFDQVVIAAAGMDTRPYRLTWPHPLTVYEIDRAAVLDFKQSRLAGNDPAPGITRRLVHADLVADDWRVALLAAGFDATKPAAWIVEGLLYYLPPECVERLLAQLRDFCAVDSRVAADLVNDIALNAPSTRQLMALYAEWGSPWLSGSSEPERLFERYGFDVTAVQPGEPGADYGRWPDPVAARDVPGIPRVFYVHGRRV
jgi:methyltransferase (TIGR00027 family)